MTDYDGWHQPIQAPTLVDLLVRIKEIAKAVKAVPVGSTRHELAMSLLTNSKLFPIVVEMFTEFNRDYRRLAPSHQCDDSKYPYGYIGKFDSAEMHLRILCDMVVSKTNWVDDHLTLINWKSFISDVEYVTSFMDR
jgi:hypothetical protein